MTLYAFDAIDDAIDATRAFLWPFDLGRWAKLAFVLFFLGGTGGSFNPFGYNFGGTGGGGPQPPDGPGGPGAPPDVLPEIGGPELAVILAIAAAIAAIVLVFAVVGSIMEFVLVESLRREAVTIRRYWGEHWGKGLRLFGFRLVLGLLLIAVFLGVLLVVFAPLVGAIPAVSIVLVVIAVPILLLLWLVLAVANGFTTVFVVPVMIKEDSGVLSAWRRFWPTMTGQWKQYAVYTVMGVVLQFAAGIVAGIATLLLMIVPGILLGIVGLVGFFSFGSGTTVGLALIVVAIALGVLALIVVSLFVAVPVQSFLRYYALFVLGDTDEALDLIPERRRAVREDDEGPTSAAV